MANLQQEAVLPLQQRQQRGSKGNSSSRRQQRRQWCPSWLEEAGSLRWPPCRDQQSHRRTALRTPVSACSIMPCWEPQATYSVRARCAGREHLLVYLRGDVDQRRHVVAEGPPDGALPAASQQHAGLLWRRLLLPYRWRWMWRSWQGLGCEGAWAGPFRVECRGLELGL